MGGTKRLGVIPTPVRSSRKKEPKINTRGLTVEYFESSYERLRDDFDKYFHKNSGNERKYRQNWIEFMNHISAVEPACRNQIEVCLKELERIDREANELLAQWIECRNRRIQEKEDNPPVEHNFRLIGERLHELEGFLNRFVEMEKLSDSQCTRCLIVRRFSQLRNLEQGFKELNLHAETA